MKGEGRVAGHSYYPHDSIPRIEMDPWNVHCVFETLTCINEQIKQTIVRNVCCISKLKEHDSEAVIYHRNYGCFDRKFTDAQKKIQTLKTKIKAYIFSTMIKT